MKYYFINPSTGILRAGWRIASLVIIFLSLNTGLMIGVRQVLGSLKAKGTLWFLLVGIAATTAVYLNRKYISKRSFASLGIRFSRNSIPDLLAGILTSALIMATLYLIMVVFGLIQFEGFSWWQDEEHSLGSFKPSSLSTMLAILFQFAVVAWWEELVFRGVILQNISEGLSIRWGVILSTLGFALVHAGNPNSTVLSTVIIMIVTLQLVYAYLKSASLWLPIGLHLGWNFFQASIFGFASSGHYSPSLIKQSYQAGDWLSGGEFGAENSILIIPLTLASFYLIHVWVEKSRDLKEDYVKDFIDGKSKSTETIAPV